MPFRTYYSLIILLFLISCQSKNNEKDFSLPSKIEINEVIKAVVLQDSLSTKIPIQIELQEIKIEQIDKDNEIPPAPDFSIIKLEKLLIFKFNQTPLFTFLDTSYINFQSKNKLLLSIDSLRIPGYTFTSAEKEKILLHKKGFNEFNSFYKPIFSKDYNKAYVQFDFNCTGLCGGGTGYFLIKRNKKWVIIKRFRRWIS